MKKDFYVLFMVGCISSVGLAAITVDFEDAAPAIYNPYDSQQGVIFTSLDDRTNPATAAPVMIIEGSWIIPNGSERALYSTPVDLEAPDVGMRFLALRADFARAASSVSVKLGNRLYTYESLYLEAYNSAGQLIGAAPATSLPSPGWVLLTVSAPNIAYVIFGADNPPVLGGSTVFADDFTYSTIPAPGALVLAATGLLWLQGLRRKRMPKP